MSHRRVRTLLNAYLDGELEEKRRKLVEEHLRECQECSEELEALKAVDQMARASKAPEPSEDYWKTLPGRVRTRIILEGEKCAASRLKGAFTLRPARLKLIATLAVLALVVLIGRHYVREGKPGVMRMGRFAEEETPPEHTLLAPTPSVPDKKSAAEPAATESSETPEASAWGDRSADEVVKLKEERIGEGRLEALTPSEARKAGPSKPGVPQEKVETYDYESGAKRARPEVPAGEALRAADKMAAVSGSARLELARSQQSRGEYEEAVRNYSLVIEEDESLAASAQFELNLIQTAVSDTGSDERTLRRKTQMWQSFVQDYAKSELTAEAYRNLADNAYQLSRLTQKRKDIEQAMAAARSYLRFVKEEQTAELYARQLNELEKDLKKVK